MPPRAALRTSSTLVLALCACGPGTADSATTGTDSDATGADGSSTSTLGMSAGAAADPPTTSVGDPGTTDDSDPVPPRVDLPAPGGALDGLFLLAVSTPIATHLPLQFLVVQRQVADATLEVEWTALSLDVNRVTTPRDPLGPPLVSTSAPLAGDGFSYGTGEIVVPGPANPLTGSSVTGTLVLSGQVVDADLMCGEVTGEIVSPITFDLTGSTFAAVRVAGVDALPTDVLIDCAGTTVTDL